MAKACLETSRRVLQTTTGQSEVQRVAVPRNLALSHLFNTIWIIIKIQVYIHARVEWETGVEVGDRYLQSSAAALGRSRSYFLCKIFLPKV